MWSVFTRLILSALLLVSLSQSLAASAGKNSKLEPSAGKNSKLEPSASAASASAASVLKVGTDPSQEPLDGIDITSGTMQADFLSFERRLPSGLKKAGQPVPNNNRRRILNGTKLGLFFLTYKNFDTRHVFQDKITFAAEMQAMAIKHSKGNFRWTGYDSIEPQIRLADLRLKTVTGTQFTRKRARKLLTKRLKVPDDTIMVISHNFGLPGWPGTKKSDYSNAGGGAAHLKKMSSHLFHHEVGHLAGLGHQGRFSVRDGEAGDLGASHGSTSNMAWGRTTGDYPYSVAGLHRLGWVPQDIIYVTPGEKVTLRSMDHPEQDHPVGLVWVDTFEGTPHFFGYYPRIRAANVMLGTPMDNGYGFVEEIAPFSTPSGIPNTVQIGTYGRDFVNQQGLRFDVHRYDDESVTLTVSLDYAKRVQRGLHVSVKRRRQRNGKTNVQAKIELIIRVSNQNPQSRKGEMVNHPVSIAGEAYVEFNGEKVLLRLQSNSNRSQEKLDGTGFLHLRRRNDRREFRVTLLRPAGKPTKGEALPATLWIGGMFMPLSLRFTK